MANKKSSYLDMKICLNRLNFGYWVMAGGERGRLNSAKAICETDLLLSVPA